MARVFVVQRAVDELVGRFRDHFPGVGFDGVADPGQFPEDALECEVLLTFQLRDGWMARMPSLRWIQCAGAGVDRVVTHPELPGEVSVTRTHSNFHHQMAEYTVAALTHHVFNWPLRERMQRERLWQRPDRALLRDRRAGVLGTGVIGSAIAVALRGLGMDVWGCSRSGSQCEGVSRAFPQHRLPEFLEGLDALVLSAPLTPETRGMIGELELKRLRPGAVLVNLARAELVQEAALRRVLDSGHLGGCYLDVFWEEPLPPESPWWEHPRVVVTTHIGGVTTAGSLADEFEQNLRRFLEGAPLHDVVDRSRGY